MSTSSPITRSTTPPAGPIVLCRVCGYDLHGLAPDDRCPECGDLVSRSQGEDVLAFASPSWLRSLDIGLLLLVVTTIAQFVFMLGSTVVSILLMALMIQAAAVGPGNANAAGTTIQTLAMEIQVTLRMAGIGMTVLSLVAMWLVAAPSPTATATTPGEAMRRALRIVVAILAVLTVATLAVLAAMQLGWIVSPWPQAGVDITAALLSTAGTVVLFLYLRHIARRIPDQALERRCKRYAWLIPVLSTVGMLLIGLGPLIAFTLMALILRRLRIAVREARRLSIEVD